MDGHGTCRSTSEVHRGHVQAAARGRAHREPPPGLLVEDKGVWGQGLEVGPGRRGCGAARGNKQTGGRGPAWMPSRRGGHVHTACTPVTKASQIACRADCPTPTSTVRPSRTDSRTKHAAASNTSDRSGAHSGGGRRQPRHPWAAPRWWTAPAWGQHGADPGDCQNAWACSAATIAAAAGLHATGQVLLPLHSRAGLD